MGFNSAFEGLNIRLEVVQSVFLITVGNLVTEVMELNPSAMIQHFIFQTGILRAG